MGIYRYSTEEAQAPAEDAPGTALVPASEPAENAAEVTPKPFHKQNPKAIRAAVKGELAARSLAGWESEFCRWLALQEKKVPEKDQLAVASALKGGIVMRKELQALKKRGPYQRLFAKEQFSQTDRELEKAKIIASRVMPKSMELAGKMIDAADEAISDPDAKMPAKLEAIRAASPLVGNMFERVWPKKHDGTTQAPQITITLSTHQAARIDVPAMESDAVDVPFEVIAEENVA